MPISVPQLGLALYTSPKVLSTSLKYLAFELENRRPFEDFFAQGRKHYVHALYPATPFEAVSRHEFPHVVAFVRDPVRRFLSMYRNRVTTKHAQSAFAWKQAIRTGLPENPSFTEFLSRFDEYSNQIQEIRHHAAPQTEFLGLDAQIYDRIFTEDSVPEFEQFIHEISGQSLRLRWEQRSGTRILVSLGEAHLSWISERYRSDYDTFGQYFPSPEEWQSRLRNEGLRH